MANNTTNSSSHQKTGEEPNAVAPSQVDECELTEDDLENVSGGVWGAAQVTPVRAQVTPVRAQVTPIRSQVVPVRGNG